MNTPTELTKTSLYTVLCTVVRLAAVLTAVSFVASTPIWIAQAKAMQPEGGQMLMIAAMFFGVLLLALLLWLYPGILAKPATAKSGHQVFESTLSAEQILTIALAVAGAWTAITALTGFGRDAIMLWLYFDPSVLAPSEAKKQIVVKLLPWVLQLILGLLLALRARGLAGVFYRLRYSRPGAAPGEVAAPSSADKETP